MDYAKHPCHLCFAKAYGFIAVPDKPGEKPIIRYYCERHYKPLYKQVMDTRKRENTSEQTKLL